MKLGEKQRKFTLMVGRLILHAYDIGYELTLGDAYRDSRVDYGHPRSLHRSRLAIDLNVFQNGEYLTDGTGHDQLHDYWDQLGGAERIDDDLNHYSFADAGMR